MMGLLRTRTERAHGWICRRSWGHICENVFSRFTRLSALRVSHYEPFNVTCITRSRTGSPKSSNFCKDARRDVFREIVLRYVIPNRMIKKPFTSSDPSLSSHCFKLLLFTFINKYFLLQIIQGHFVKS